jgi:hypothetical protein
VTFPWPTAFDWSTEVHSAVDDVTSDTGDECQLVRNDLPSVRELSLLMTW